MALIKFQNGQTVRFNGDPTPQDIEEVATKLGLQKAPQMQQEAQAPQEQKPFTFDVAQPKVDLQTKLANANKQAEQYKQEAQKASSPLGFASNVGRGAFDYMAASEIGLGKTLGQVYGGDQGNSIANSMVSLQNSNAQLYKQIKDREASGKDATNIKQAYNKNVKLIQEMEKDRKSQGELPTDLEFGGQVVGTALDIVTAGQAQKGMKFGQLYGGKNVVNSAKNAILHPTYDTVKQGLKTLVQPVRPEISNTLNMKPANLLSKQWAKDTAKNTGIGYINDVSMNAQGFNGEENAKGMNVWKPGLGTKIGFAIPTALAGEQSSKTIYKSIFNKDFKNNKIINNREIAINKVIKDNANLRKLKSDTQTIKLLAESDALVGKVDSDGVIRTMENGGAWDEFRNSTIKGMDDTVTRAVEREGKSLSPDYVEKHLTKVLNESNLAGTEKKAVLNGIKNEVEGLMLDATSKGEIPVTAIQKSKIGKGMKTNYLDPVADKVTKTITRGLKELVENNTQTIDAKKVNAEIGKYKKVLKLIEKLDGKRVKGGKLGKYFAQGFGAMIGTAIGGPVGGVVGIDIGGRIKSRNLINTFGKETGRTSIMPKILKEASDIANSPKPQPKYKLLSSPSFIAGQPRTYPEPKMTILNAKKGVPGRNPKTGRLFATLSSEGQSQSPNNIQSTKAKVTVPISKTIKSNKLFNTPTLPQKKANVKTRLPIKTKGTESAFGSVAGIEIDENGKITFNKEKALAGIFAMAVSRKITKGSAGLSVIKKNLPMQIKYYEPGLKKYLDNIDFSKAKNGAEAVKLIDDAIPNNMKTPDIKKSISNWSDTAKIVENNLPFNQGAVPKTAKTKLLGKSNPLIQEAKAYQFVSPNIKDVSTFEDATIALETKIYKNNFNAVENVYTKDGIYGRMEKGIGDWADGAEETYIKKIINDVPSEKRIYSLAKNSRELKQKDAIDFSLDVKGKDELFILEGIPTIKMRDILNSNGIKFKTIGEKELYVVNSGEYFDASMVDKMKKIAYDNGIDINKRSGTATFITGADDRAVARNIYDNIINNYEKRYGIQRGTKGGLQGNTVYGKSIQKKESGEKIRKEIQKIKPDTN
jgi:hypothetical protein